ncbi:MAG: ComEC/Rec2 family competence protein [Mycoplasma sp.]|nr:ComEC/Rec2 family competence protein [Mycoplasma sp.]
MRRYRLIAWGWYSYFKSSKGTTRYKLRYLITGLNAIFLFLSIKNQTSIYIISSVLLNIILLTNPKYLVASLFTTTLMLIIWKLSENSYIPQQISGEYSVNKILSKGVVIKVNNNNVFLWTKIHLNVHDIIFIKGKIITTQNEKIKGFLEQNNIKNLFKGTISLLDKDYSLTSKIRDFFSNGSESTRKIMPLLYLNDVFWIDKTIQNQLKSLSIIHLFVVSGFHLSLFFICLKKLLSLMRIPYSKHISLIPLAFYVYIVNFSTPSIRSFIMIALSTLPIKKFNKLDGSGISMILISIFFPRSVISMSFIFSFAATCTICFITSFKLENKIQEFFLINIFVYIISLPLIIHINNWFSIFGIFYNILFTPIVSIFYILGILFLPFSNIEIHLCNLLIFLFEIISKTTIIINVNFLSLNIAFIYYIIFIICILFMEQKITLYRMRKNELLIR